MSFFLSMIIPAHNEERRLPPTLTAVNAYLGRQAYTSEIIVVENGSQDLTAVVAEAFAADHPRVRLIRESARGKGLAVRRGMLEARGAYRFICDADLSMPIEEVAKFLPPQLSGYDVAIGCMELKVYRRLENSENTLGCVKTSNRAFGFDEHYCFAGSVCRYGTGCCYIAGQQSFR